MAAIQGSAALIAIISAAHEIGSTGRSTQFEIDETLVETALRHRVTFSLHAAVVQKLFCCTERAQILLERHTLACARRHLHVRKVLLKVAEILSQSNIPFLLYKGLSLQHTWYGSVARVSGDIDLIVEEELHNAAAVVLMREGAVVNHEEADSRTTVTPLTFDGVLIELHGLLVESYIASLPGPRSLASRSHSILIDSDRPVLTLNEIDHVVALLVHGFKHQWCRLLWILDIALAVRALGRDGIHKILERSGQYGITKIARLGLGVSGLTFGPIGDELMNEEIVENSMRYRNRLLDPGAGPRFKLENAQLHLLGIEGFRKRLRYVSARVLG